MTSASNKNKWIHIASGILLLAAFFLPWAKWKETLINGYYMPAGKFFAIAESQFGQPNPYPQLNFTFYAFWLIPIGALISIILAVNNRKNIWVAGVSGAMTLALVTTY